MLASDFDYELPESSIAQSPLRQRERCRLCVVERGSDTVTHGRFSEIGRWLKAGDLLVLNNSRVVRARVPCQKEGSGGAVEVFLLEPPGALARTRFNVFFKPARKAQPGVKLRPALNPDAGYFEVISQGAEAPGIVEWHGNSALDAAALESLGVMPLPPYIKRERLPDYEISKIDARYYQNIFAREDGSAAAPTAGLHFSQNLIASLKQQGILFSEVTLHVGAGTFLPVKTEDLDQHHMHSERYCLPESSLRAIQTALAEGRRVIPVGTTALRVLESAWQGPSAAVAGWAETSIFIKPGHPFRVAGGLITNFHQPRSTLLALVSALYRREKILKIYTDCLDKKYRFLSYGDAMLLI